MAYTKINWQNLPSTQTPINDTNLKHMDDGIYANDQAIATKATLEDIQDNLVNVSTEVDDTYRVNLLHSKNLLNNSPSIWIRNNSENPAFTDDTNQNRIRTKQPQKLEANKTYTISGIPSGITLGIVKFYASASSTTVTSSTSTNTFTVPANATYVIFQFNGENFTDETKTTMGNANIMLNEGSTATTYEPFIQNKIVVDNEKYSDTINVGASLDSRSRVNVLKSKNLMRIRTIPSTTSNGITYSIDNDGTITLNGTATAQVDINYLLEQLKTEANISYCLSYIYISGSMTSGKLDIYNQDGNHNWQGYNINIYNEIAQNNKVDLRTYTTDMNMAGARTIRLSNGTVVNNLKFKTMLVKSNVADYDYEPYITPSIYVDNEMLVSKNVYSTGEVLIGEWFGKPLYRKVVTISSLPNNTATDYDVFSDTSEINECWVDVGMSYVSLSNNSLKYPVNWLWTTSAFMFTGMNGKKLRVKTTENQSSNSGYFVINYTKNKRTL